MWAQEMGAARKWRPIFACSAWNVERTHGFERFPPERIALCPACSGSRFVRLARPYISSLAGEAAFDVDAHRSLHSSIYALSDAYHSFASCIPSLDRRCLELVLLADIEKACRVLRGIDLPPLSSPNSSQKYSDGHWTPWGEGGGKA